MNVFEMLCNRVESAAQRSRWILLVSIVISLAQIGSAYNFTFGFLRDYTEYVVFEIINKGLTPNELQSAMMKTWIDQLSVNVNLVGLKFSVADASLVGSIALLIISTWLFYASRRENHLIGNTLIVSSTEPAETKRYVFLSLCGSQMFGTLSNTNEPIRTLNGNKPLSVGKTHTLVKLMIYMPVITVSFMIATDLLSLWYLKSVFRGSEETLYTFLDKNNRFGDIMPRLIFTIFFELILLAIVTHILRSVVQFQKANISLLKEADSNDWGKISKG